MKTLQYREAERLWVDEELVKDDDVTAFGQLSMMGQRKATQVLSQALHRHRR